MKRSPKTELLEDGLQGETFQKRRFPVLVWTRIFLKTDKKKLRQGLKDQFHAYRPVFKLLRGESFLCHVFLVKSIQNIRTFWRTTQNLLSLALLCSLYSRQTLKVHLGVEKHIER